MKVKIKRLIALFIGIVLVGVLLITYSGLRGNPFTKIKAKQEIKDYLTAYYPNETYKCSKVTYNFKDNSYIIDVDIKDSEDKDFRVNYQDGNVYDDYKWQVTQRYNTRNRLEMYLNQDSNEEFIKELFGDNYDFSIMTITEEAWQKQLPGLDMSIDELLAMYPIDLVIYLNDYEKLDTSKKDELKETIINHYLQIGIHINKLKVNHHVW